MTQPIREILSAAIEIQSAGERRKYLDEACGGDSVLRDEIEALVQAHLQAGSFFADDQEPENAALDETVLRPRANDSAGNTIGPYKLLQQIGQGGMGSVWMAEQQEPVRRMVALKIIKAGMDSSQVIARFEAERQALALMNHPNIAKVLDAGTTDNGRPYFVMELVKGVRITEFCGRNKYPPAERLKLFIDVCRAVQHAHQKGIIHRDIKPSNVMVTLHDGVPVVKVIDFGLAKATSQKLTERTLFTAYGQMVGTPSYMSPEQAEMSGLDVDTRTDVYSLGVLLYELMTGTTPIDANSLRKAGFVEIQRLIQEQEAPPMSTRLSSLGASSSMIAGKRGSDVSRLSQLLRGDLDVIVLKSLDKDRSRRYLTPSDFADDVQRFLANEAIEARPASAAYRLKKLYQRNRAAVLTSVFVACVLVAATVFSSIQAIRASIAVDGLETEQTKTLAALEQAETAEHEARRQSELAVEAREAVEVSLQSEQSARKETEDQLRIATAMRLAAQSKSLGNDRPVPSMLLAIEAVETTRRHDGAVFPLARESLIEAVDRVGGRVLNGHEGYIYAAAVTPDSRWLVTGGGDTTARLWDLTADDPAGSSVILRGHENMVADVAVSPDGHWVATASYDKTARVWDLTAEDPSASSVVLRGHTEKVLTVAISPDSRWLATSGEDDMTARLWDLGAEDPSASSVVIKGHERRVLTAEFSPDGRWLVTCSGDRTARLWDLLTDEPSATSVVLRGHEQTPANVGFSPDSRWLVTGSLDGTVRLWDLAADDPSVSSKVLGRHQGYISEVAISPDGRWVITASTDNTVRLWRLNADKTSDSSVVLRGHAQGVSRLAIGPQSRWLVTGSSDKTARLWDLTADDPAASSVVLKGHENVIGDIVITPDGRQVITVSYDGTIRLWDLADEHPSASFSVLRGHQDAVYDLAISPDSRWVVTGSADDTARLWDLTTDDPSASSIALRGHTRYVSEVAISPDNRWFVTGSADNTARLWDLKADDPSTSSVVLGAHTRDVMAVEISPDGHWVATGSLDSTVRLWDLTADDPSASTVDLRGHAAQVLCVAIGPDGRWLVTGSVDKTARLWDLSKDDPSASPVVLRGHEDIVYDVAISPDGHWVMTSSQIRDRTVRL